MNIVKHYEDLRSGSLLAALERVRGCPYRVRSMDEFHSRHTHEISSEVCKSVMPLVSVVVIAYKQERYIRKTLDSIVCQKSDFNYEVVIGDDCSPDGTRMVCEEYQKKYPHLIRVVYSDSNGGVWLNLVRTRNAARGQYIALCEGDDWWCDEDKLQKQVNYLIRNPNMGIVYSDFSVYKMASGELAERCLRQAGFFEHTFEQRNFIVERFPGCKGFGWFQTASILMRNSLFEELKTDRPFMLDSVTYDYQLRSFAAMKSTVGFIPDNCVVYRFASGLVAKFQRSGNIALCLDVLYLGCMRSWDYWTNDEKRAALDKNAMRLAAFYNAPWAVKLRIAQYVLGFHCRIRGVSKLVPIVKLLFNFHIFPQWVLRIRYNHAHKKRNG